MQERLDELHSIAEEARAGLASKHRAREQALRLSRQAIQSSAQCIRAIHRGQFEQAKDLLEEARTVLQQVEPTLDGHSDVYFAGFIEDSQKEYVEANTTLALVTGSKLPGPVELCVGFAPYLNGIAEAVGELRRYILDALRRDTTSRSEELLGTMDEIYTILVTMDFPDAITRGLRRSTDMVRGVLERTRGDLTMALRQRTLEKQISAFLKAQGEPEKA